MRKKYQLYDICNFVFSLLEWNCCWKSRFNRLRINEGEKFAITAQAYRSLREMSKLPRMVCVSSSCCDVVNAAWVEDRGKSLVHSHRGLNLYYLNSRVCHSPLKFLGISSCQIVSISSIRADFAKCNLSLSSFEVEFFEQISDWPAKTNRCIDAVLIKK